MVVLNLVSTFADIFITFSFGDMILYRDLILFLMFRKFLIPKLETLPKDSTLVQHASAI